MDVVEATLWLLFTVTISVTGTSVVDFRSPTTNYSPGPVQEGWTHSWDLKGSIPLLDVMLTTTLLRAP